MVNRDSQVRSHEAAHKAAAGSLASGGPSFSTQRGPDGKFYPVGGEVQIDTSPGSNPRETVAKARQIRSAALAPADPSPQDLKVAAASSIMEAAAMKEILQARQESENPDMMNPGEKTGAFEVDEEGKHPLSARLSRIYRQNDGQEEVPLFEIRV